MCTVWLQSSVICLPITYKRHTKEIKMQYAIPIYNLEEIENIPDQEIQFTINDQLFLDVLLMELSGKVISCSSYKPKERNKKENI